MHVFPALSLLVVSVAATSLQERQSPFPPCALQCISSADLGGCPASDTRCTCKNKFVEAVTRCFYASCTGSDLINSLTTAQQICRSVGVTLTLTSTPAITATPSRTGSVNSSTQAIQTGLSASSSSSTSKSNDVTLTSTLVITTTSSGTSSANSSTQATQTGSSASSSSSTSKSNDATLTSTPVITTTSSGTGSANSSAQATQTGSSASSSSSTSKSNDATYLHINSLAVASALGFIAVTLPFL